MPDWPIIKHVDPFILSTLTPQSLGQALNAMGLALGNVAAWPVSNKAYFIPHSVSEIITIRKMFIINGTVSGNVDVGIYDRNGVRLVSIGSTAQAGASVIQEFDITDTILLPGLYYLAAAMDNTTGQVDSIGATLSIARSQGVAEMTTAFPLPATATFAAVSGTTRIPFIGATQRTFI